MSKKAGIAVAVLSMIAICVSLFAVSQVKELKGAAKEDDQDVQYVLYLGTNDKDTNEPALTVELE